MIELNHSALLTDLYQLTMLQGYVEAGQYDTAVFELFARRLGPGRNFLVAAGLDQALDFLESFHFTEPELRWLADSGRFESKLVDYLASMRFTGDVTAMPEGTLFFANEPIVRVTAPLPEAQIVESRLMNLLHYPSLVASKAARCVLAAPDKLLVEFGLRRAHGAEAALLAGRAAYIAGFSGTSNVLAGAEWNIPLYGTMAHSFIQSHDDEATAFVEFARSNRQDVVLLIDTYDTEAAARKVAALAPTLKAEGIKLRGVRIDSGDLAEHACRVRHILDDADLRDVTIFASSSLDEREIAALLAKQAPIDGFGVGTSLDVSADRPFLDFAYKLQEYAGRPRRKRSEGKATWPGRKQVFRRLDAEGRLAGDCLALESEAQPGEALLKPVMQGGHRLASSRPLAELRAATLENLAQLPDALRSLDAAEPYNVTIGDSVRALADELDRTREGTS
jgi:nicotinate phosphoribosyltransferase